MKFVASRISEGNRLFPAEIHIEDNGIKVRIPGFLSGDTRFINYENITAVDINTPMIGYSSITFYYQGNKAFAHGFTKNDAKAIKAAIDEGRQRAKTITVNHVNAQGGQIVNSQQPTTQIVNKTPSLFSSVGSALGGAIKNTFEESRKAINDEKEKQANTANKIEEIALISFSGDADEIQNILNYLVTIGSSKPDKNLKKVIIEKIEFGVMKLNSKGAIAEASYFSGKLEQLKKKNFLDFLDNK